VHHIRQEENLAERIEQKTGVTKADNLNRDGPRKNRECSEQESDAQVSFKISEHNVVWMQFHSTNGRLASTIAL